MINSNVSMTRCQVQTEALIIESLLNAVMAIQSSEDPQEAVVIVELACDRARRLNVAMDSINAISEVA